MNPEHPYTSYLLRLWQTKGEQGEVWRASLESPDTGKRQGFTSLTALFTFLETSVAQKQANTVSNGEIS